MPYDTETTDRAAHTLADLRAAAAAVLPPDVWDFVAGGSGDETTLAANRAALDRVAVVPRVMRDVSRCTTGSSLLGGAVGMPVATAPIAYQRLVHPDGELAAASAAKAAGVPFVAGTLSSATIEEIAEVAGALWFQLYWLRDTARVLDLVRRAEDAGCTVIMLTADVPWMGRRLRDMRNGFALPPHIRAANLDDDRTAHQALAGGSAVAAHTSQALSPALTWSSVAMLRARTTLKIVIKGVLAPADAVRAVECGADAVVVSNHGGRQLDGAVASVDALPGVVTAVGDSCEVMLDSGIRSGTDVLRALALGASGVLLGRPLLWGLAAGGETGARQVLELLGEELRHALGLAGCDSVAEARQLQVVRG